MSEAKSTPSPIAGRALAFIAIAVFITQFAHPGRLGSLPFQVLLKDGLHADPEDMAIFFAISAIAWHLRPIAGLVTDRRFVGARRGTAIAVTAALSAGGWVAVALVPQTIAGLACATLAVNLATLVAFAAVGGFGFELGQRHGMTGRVASIKTGVLDVAVLVSGPLGSWLAHRALWVTCAIGAAFQLALVAATRALYPRTSPPATDRPPKHALATVGRTLGSRPFLASAGLAFLFFIGPAAGTPLFYYQSAVLGFSPELIGLFTLVFGATGIAGALLYANLSRRVELRTLLVVTPIANAATAALFVFYRTPASAAIVTGAIGLSTAPLLAALFDFANRAAPPHCESFAFACLASVVTLTITASDLLGAWLFQHVHVPFFGLVAITAGTTLLIAACAPLLPRDLTR